MFVKDHSVFIIPFTARTATGEWLAEDDFRSDGGYTKPKRYQSVVVAPTKELAIAHMRYWSQFGYSAGQEYTILEAEIVEHRIDTVIHVSGS